MRQLLGEYRSKGDRVLYLQEFMVYTTHFGHKAFFCEFCILGDDGCCAGGGLDQIPAGQGSAHSREGHEENIQTGRSGQGWSNLGAGGGYNGEINVHR